MRFEEIREELMRILQQGNGVFRTAYQIFALLADDTKNRLIQQYPVLPGRPLMGANAGIYYSPASFIAHALDYFYRNNNADGHIVKKWVDSQNVRFEGYEPGYKEMISIWALE